MTSAIDPSADYNECLRNKRPLHIIFSDGDENHRDPQAFDDSKFHKLRKTYRTMANNENEMIERPRRSRSSLAAVAVLVWCTMYIASFLVGPISQNKYIDANENLISRQRFLKSSEAVNDLLDQEMFEGLDQVLVKLRSYLTLTPAATVALPVAVAQGAGPELTGLTGQFHHFIEPRHQGVSWYKLLSSPKFQWNMAPLRWNHCQPGNDVFLGDTGFSFHELDPNDNTQVISKFLRFRVLRKDERECLWNHSRSCLAGGSLVMNFGKTAMDMLYPGNYSLKTNDGVIRIVAYNTVRACSRKQFVPTEDGEQTTRRLKGTGASSPEPLDYLRQAIPSTLDPVLCETWIQERESKGDLFSFNSDYATVHIDTPWMQIVIQVYQSKVLDETCDFASMNVLITDVSPELLEDNFGGMLGDERQTRRDSRALNRRLKRRGYQVSHKENNIHEVDGPFGTRVTLPK
mmetsp:Transcript_16217/g.34242  ORF Transcript_16217/g.34242 Transcript_16217/m.34242 type:complete len:460 (+) Transcript_16217:215-1594(+)|eukprot:CAMPEP_0183742168 /NCGR_PEP_ID=MMETSP0737-20130205/64099_1 /TAXON_ID=385413 /ORGANISM="Thalassiosira miniscula, Strain CCMP1093" /LENGTH=459 /DNA_ID=CAMNT_0025977709 /DNA_START=126 /DNA_END=1505 /DNA_ORIENTATION=+